MRYAKKKKRVAAGMLVAVVLLGYAVPVESQPPRSAGSEEALPEQDPAQIEPPDSTKYVATAVNMFQLQAAVDFAKAVETFHGEEAFAFALTSSPPPPQFAWEYFFSAAMIVIAPQQDETYVVAHYNPYLDAAVLAVWKYERQQPAKIIAATLMSGAELEKPSDAAEPRPPRWLDSGKSPPEALPDQFTLFWNAFRRRFPQGQKLAWVGSRPDSKMQQAVLAHARLASGLLYAMQVKQDPAVVRTLEDFRTALYDGNRPGLERMLSPESRLTAEEILQIPEQIREDLVGLYALGEGSEVVLIMADPKYPTLCAMLRYSIEPPGRILSFDLFAMSRDQLAAEETEGGKQ